MSLKKEINLLKSQSREQQEVTLKSKIEILKINEDKEKIQNDFDVLTTIQIDDNNKMVKKINYSIIKMKHLPTAQTTYLLRKKVTALTQNIKTVNATEFFEKMLEISNQRESIESQQFIGVKNNLKTKSIFQSCYKRT